MTLGCRWRAAMQGRAVRLVLAILFLSYCHMHLLGGFVEPAVAGSYTAANETELRDAIDAANADGDPDATITLTNNISIGNPAAFPTLTKPTTIDTGAFTLTANDVTVGTGTSLTFQGGSLLASGTFQGGNQTATNSNAAGGIGILYSNGAVENNATVTGGKGSNNTGVGRTAGAGGAGMSLANSSLLNHGSITGGLGGSVDLNFSGSNATTVAGGGGAGLIMSGGALDNQGSITGGTGGTFIDMAGGAGSDNKGGGWGGVGVSLTGGTHVNNGTIVGGVGGAGMNAGASTHGGGGGGAIVAGGASLLNNGTITGGNGMTGGGSAAGSGSPGGFGVTVTSSTFTNTGTVQGGHAGATQANSAGTGILGSNATVINSGTISAGRLSLGAGALGNAIQFTAGTNRLELRAGSVITGNVLGATAAGSSDTLVLGGSTNSSFDVSQIGAAAQYRNFDAFEKTGTSTWTLTNTTTATTPWTLFDGVLSISSAGALGATAGRLTFSGGTLQTTSAFTDARAITVAAAGGTVETMADLTWSGIIDGAGALTKTGSGTLTLSGTNSYGGGTFLNDGVVSVSTDANLGNAAGPLTFDGGTLENTGAFATGRAVTLDAGGGTFQTDADLTLTGAISGTGGFVKAGSETLILSGTNTYQGATTISAGTLLVNGDQSGATGLTTAENGATLGGIGTIGGSVNVADGGRLAPGQTGLPGTLTIVQDLALSSGSQLDFQFGATGEVGGTLNDHVQVGGNLLLDGTLNVTVPPGGAFGPGIYRVFTYGGTLDNQILDLNSPDPDLYVQTSLPGQVNLVNTAGLTLRYWDGAAGPKNDSVIDGGNGTWQTQDALANDNWTTEDGTPNAPWTNAAFAVFMGTAGTVSVDNSLGQVRASGMQFLTDGYVIEGQAIELHDPADPTGGSAYIQVGDGSAESAGVTATITASLFGNAQLVKGHPGTLILSGTNTYLGGTRIEGGTLQVAADNNLGGAAGGLTFNGGTLHNTAAFSSGRLVTLEVGGGTFETMADLTLSGVITGAGGLTKTGSAALVLTGTSNDYTGDTTVDAGTLRAGAVNTFSAGSAHFINANGTLDLNGFDQTLTSLDNAGTVRTGGAPGTTLTVGTYNGDGGILRLNTTLNDDVSVTDRLVATTVLGTSTLQITNVGGTGAQTINGIKVVDVGNPGASPGTFTLQGDYVFNGQQAVVGGAFAYTLHQHGVSTPGDGDWYLRSELISLPGPAYQPGIPVYEAYAQVLLGLNGLPTLQQRAGNRYWGGGAASAPLAPAIFEDEAAAQGQQLMWGRMEARRTRQDPRRSTTLSDYESDQLTLQTGLDGLLAETGSGKLIGSLTGQYATASAEVASIYGNGEISSQGFGLGGTLTWYGRTGFYVDGQAQFNWLRSDLTSDLAGTLEDDNRALGHALGLEVGQRFAAGPWAVVPQAQLVYSNVDFNGFNDTFGAHVALRDASSLIGRFGLAAQYDDSWRAAAGLARASVYGIANLYYDALDGSEITVAGLRFETAHDRLWGGLGAGGTYSWADGRYAVYGEALASTSLEHFGDSYSYSGMGGVRVRW